MSTASSDDVTGLLLQWNEEKLEAREQLIPLVYRELRRLAARSMKSGMTQRAASLARGEEADRRYPA